MAADAVTEEAASPGAWDGTRDVGPSRWVTPRQRRQRGWRSRWARGARLVAAMRGDWRGERVMAYASLTVLAAAALALLFHVNRPEPYIPYHDTLEYVRAGNRIASGGWWVDPARLPGYPLLLAGVFLLFGKGNLAAADVAQDALFVVAALQIFILAYRIWKSSRYAVAIGLLFATNFTILSYFKPILSDGLAVVVTLALALAALALLDRPTPLRFWMMALCVAALIFTRAEWVLVPAPLFALIVWMVRGRAPVGRLLVHAAVAVALIYGLVLGYVALNARLNGYAGLTDATEINLYGKVMQYHMQDEASPRFRALTRLSDAYAAAGKLDPWVIYWHNLALGQDHFRLLGAYARDIVTHHPARFLFESAKLAVFTLAPHPAFAKVETARRAAKPLLLAQELSDLTFALFLLFPLCALGWIVVLTLRRWRGAGDGWRARAMCLLCALAIYEIAMTTLGSYGEYTRLHLTADPLMLVVVVGTLVTLLSGRGAARHIPAVETPAESLDVQNAWRNAAAEASRRTAA